MPRFLFYVLSLAAVPAVAQTVDMFAGMPGVTIADYDVAGDDAAAIRAQIEAKGPVDPNDPARSFGGATTFAIRWRWPIDRAGRCDLTAARVTFAATVTLPRLTGDVPDTLRNDWDRYRAALERHEAEHVRYAYDRRGDIARACLGRGLRDDGADVGAAQTGRGRHRIDAAHRRRRERRGRAASGRTAVAGRRTLTPARRQ